MDLMKTEYEFLDLSDVKEAELSSLQCALYQRQPGENNTALQLSIAHTSLDLSSCSSSTAGPLTVSSSLDSLSGGEGEMAPHSPQRSAGAAPSGAPPPGPPHLPPPQPPYVQPPPPYGPPPPQQWPVAPPNVYVSQVTANVNVHGYMGQYYQPPQPQYVPQQPQGERQPRNHRRDRRKRPPSPPPAQAPPYYVPYPQYYTPAQAQGAPLYHMPVYQPVAYVPPYPYSPYYPEYQIPVDEGGDKVQEEYPPEMIMEQEAVDAYYAGAHYPGPTYGPPPDGAIEYVPPMYLPPPPPHPHQAITMPHQPPHQPTPHQFNVHAKNFVQNSNKTYMPPENKAPEQRTPSVSAATQSDSIESLQIKDLKVTTKEPNSPKHGDIPPKESPTHLQNEKPPLQQAEPPKQNWSPPETKTETQTTPTIKNFPTTGASPAQSLGAAAKVLPPMPKIAKGPAPAPFAAGKQVPKPMTVPQATLPLQQVVNPKVPFPSRQRRDGPGGRSPERSLDLDKPAIVQEHIKREPPLPASKAPMPISITLHSQGPPLITTNKSPFGHSRKSIVVPEPPPAPQPPPPAPTASDFPPPPTPRNRGEPQPTPPVQQPQPAPGKSWASLFSSNKSPLGSVPPAPAPIVAPVITLIEEPVPTPTPVITNIQKPVAKVPPFDASPLQQTLVEKTPPPRTIVSTATVVSYSEKTSANSSSAAVSITPKSTSPSQASLEVRDVPIQKEMPPPTPVQPSPFADDPNSYRMGEFLSKYQLDHRSIPLLPRGLTNRSNFCYVNAILQALIACPPFYNMLKALPYQTRRGKSSTPVIDAMVELCYEFTPLPANVRVSRARGTEGPAGALPVQTGPPLDPAAGQKVLRALTPFPGSQEGRQEDAEEFLGCLLNGLNDEMLELMKLVEPEELKEVSAQQNGVIAQEQQPLEEEDDDDEWKVMGPKNKGAIERLWAAGRTPLSDIFRGRTRCRLHRATHHDVTDAVQPFFTLQLDIERSNNVKDALELLAGRDTLEGVTDAWQQLSIEQLPVVLLLHLKCFQLDTEGKTAKIVKSIDFPIDLKVDPKIMSSKQKYASKQRLYKLFAVVYHEGVEAVKGHYLTDTYHGQAGWIRYDDSTVTLVSDAQVLKPKPPRMPYLLMYRRSDTLPTPHRPIPKTE